MPERIEKLRATVTELEAELASITELDDPTRALLEEAVSELQATLQKQPAEIEHHSLTERLHESAKAFESSHPTLYGIVSRTIDALAQMGI
jgi:vacuolar-type H+-ATPase subunit I/STV1